MKIGYLVKNLDRGTGGGRFAADIIDGIKKLGHETVVLREIGERGEGYPILGRGSRMILSAFRARVLLKGCDVIHAIDGYPYGVIAWIANRKIGARLVISALGTYAVAPLYKWPSSFLLKKAYRTAHVVAPISRFTQQEIFKKIDLKNTEIVHPGIQVEGVKPRLKSDKKFILGVGGIKERKGYHISLVAFAEIASEFPDISYVIVGDEDRAFQTILDAIVEERHLTSRVKFLHSISEEELDVLYRGAELFILTPINTPEHHFEGYGLVFLEAARAGLPVIGTRGTGAEDAINEGYNGILVGQENREETRDAIRSILKDPQKQQRMRDTAFEWAKTNSIEKEVERLIKIYKH